MSAPEYTPTVLPVDTPTRPLVDARAEQTLENNLNAELARIAQVDLSKEATAGVAKPYEQTDQEKQSGLTLARVVDYATSLVRLMETGSPGNLASETGAAISDVAEGAQEAPLRAPARAFLKDIPQKALRVVQAPGQMWQELVFGKGGPLEDVKGLNELKVRQAKLQDEIGLEIAPPESETGKIAEELFAWLIPFRAASAPAEGLLALTRLPLAVQKFLQNPVALGLASSFMEDPLQKTIDKVKKEHPELADPIQAAIDSEDGDAFKQAFARLEAAANGVIAGVLFDGLLNGVKIARDLRIARFERKNAKIAEVPKPTEPIDKDRISITEIELSNPNSPLVRAGTGDVAKERLAQARKVIDEIFKDAHLTRFDLEFKAQQLSTELEINYEKITKPEDVKKLIDNTTRIFSDMIEEARRGKRSHDVTRKAGRALNEQAKEEAKILTPEEVAALWRGEKVPGTEDMVAAAKFFGVDATTLLERTNGQAWNAEQTMAAVSVWSAAAKMLNEAITEAAGVDLKGTGQIKFRRALAVFGAISAQVMGIRAEAGRALNIWAEAGRLAGGDAERALVLTDLVERYGGIADTRKLAIQMKNMLESGLSPRQIAETGTKTMLQKASDAFTESVISGYLWLPTTHLTNMISPYVMLLDEMMQRAVGRQIGKFTTLPGEESIVAGEPQALAEGAARGVRQLIPGSEIAADAFLNSAGLASSVKSYFSLWWQQVRSPNKASFADKYDASSGAIKQIAQDIPEGFFKNLTEFYGALTSVPGRALHAEDIISRGIVYEASRTALALRRATLEGGSAEEIAARYAEYVNNPPEWLRIKAAEEAQRMTFTSKTGGGDNSWVRVGQMRGIAPLMKGVRSIPVLGPLVLPFVDVLANMTRAGVERTPLAWASAQWREAVMKGGVERDSALARAAVGTAAVLAVYDLAEAGLCTGRLPSKPGDRQAWQDKGIQPNSCKIGDTWVSSQALGPAGFLLSLAGTMRQVVSEREIDGEDQQGALDIISALLLATEQAFESQTMAKGIIQSVDAVRRQDQGALDYINRQVQSVIPLNSPLKFLRRATDATLPDYNNPWQAVEAMIPIWEKTLPRMKSIWGEDIADTEEFGRGFALLSPFRTSEEKVSPVDKEMIDNHMNIEKIRKKTSFGHNGVTVDVDFHQFPLVYEIYTELSGSTLKIGGEGAKAYLERRIQSPDYKQKSGGPNGKKREFFFSTIHRYRDAAQRKIMDPNGVYQDAEFANFRQYVNGLVVKSREADRQRNAVQ